MGKNVVFHRRLEDIILLATAFTGVLSVKDPQSREYIVMHSTQSIYLEEVCIVTVIVTPNNKPALYLLRYIIFRQNMDARQCHLF